MMVSNNPSRAVRSDREQIMAFLTYPKINYIRYLTLIFPVKIEANVEYGRFNKAINEDVRSIKNSHAS